MVRFDHGEPSGARRGASDEPVARRMPSMMAHVVVTGASSGIGEALVREYVRAGASVTMVARRRELMEKLAAEVGGKTHVVATDLGDPAHATDWLAGAEAALGPVDILVNNAGAQIVGVTSEVEWARARAM